MAKHPKDLLRRQEITLDNHHPNTPLVWDKNIHIHKRMTISNRGKNASVSGEIYLAEERGVEVTFDEGKRHRKMNKADHPDEICERLKKEIRDALSNDGEARAFVGNIAKTVRSLSSGMPEKIKSSRCREAFNNVMRSLGVSEECSKSIMNRNGDIISFYVDAPKSFPFQDYLLHAFRLYNRNYHLEDLQTEPPIYYITFLDNTLVMGELTPFAMLNFRLKGFRMSAIGLIEDELIND